ncbi:hypothetical protein ACJMK2_000786 [Sinanodonta woodiana]|uniref:P/Homo B domain-containing protein n=1 Tax=Sinanodonta woodiana TaxID=1069815 RepID=A0ABD3XQB7_SINWO
MEYFTKSLVGVICWTCFTFDVWTELVANEYVLVFEPRYLQTVEAVSLKYNLTLKRKLFNDTFLFVKLDEPAQAEKGNYTWDIESFKADLGNMVTLIEQQILRMFAQPKIQKAGAATGTDDGWNQEPDKEKEVCNQYYAMEIEDAWTMSYEGNNVTVAIVDIGVELTHKDLNKNIDLRLSYNYFKDDYNANPPDHTDYPERVDIEHGSKCAGLVAALRNNDFCSAGVAPKSRLAAIRFMSDDGCTTDAWLVSALEHKRTEIDIYSCSWALPSLPFSVAQPMYQRVLSEGVQKGRDSKGSVFIFAAGNYDSVGNCNADGYINTIYGITITSVGINGTKPFYDPVCACALASTFGEGNSMTSYHLCTTGRNNSCARNFRRTSASAALASGIIALTLEANPSLTWRDVQHIIVETASIKGLEHSGKWMVNGAGKKVSPYFGFGLMNASAMVKLAETWTLVGPKGVCHIKFTDVSEEQNVSQGFREVRSNVWTNGCRCTDCHITKLEHVQVKISIETLNVSGIEIYLSSAMSANQLSSPLYTHTKSLHSDRTTQNISWVFNTVHFWGENPNGTWEILIKYNAIDNTKLLEAELILHGTNTNFTSSEKCNRRDDTNALNTSSSATENKMSTTSSLPSNINGNESHGLPIGAVVLIVMIPILILIALVVFILYRCRLLQCISPLKQRSPNVQSRNASFSFSLLKDNDRDEEDSL